MILFIKHIDIEGPATMGMYFQDKGFSFKTVELYNNEQLPEQLSGIDAVVSLGGPMNVYEEEKHPFLRQENEFIQKVLAEEIPFLGLCLGSQLLAKASGAEVSKSPVEEIGWFKAQITEEGKKDQLFSGIEGLRDPSTSPPSADSFRMSPCGLQIFQWHEDTFMIPDGAVRLVTADGCANQAFRLGPCAYGFQFHIEITKEDIAQWSSRYKNQDQAFQQKAQQMVKHHEETQDRFNQQAEQFYENFLKIIVRHKALA